MLSKTFNTAVVALAASSMVAAQTHTDCNPLKESCKPDPAFGNQKVDCDFTKGFCKEFKALEGTDIKTNGQGAVFKIEKATNAPTIQTNKYIMFGRVDVTVQAAEGAGIVTSAVLQSDDLDEIDLEWVGGDNKQVQSNYFSKGDTTTYDRAVYHPVAAPLTSTHKYSVEWTSTKIDWLIDDAIVRTLNAADAKGGEAFPQTPMQIKLGTWVAGGKNSNAGTREWAGGYTDFDDAPFNAYYKSVTITDYAGKDAAGQGAGVKEYVYGDKTGSWQSIKVKKGDSDDDDEETTTTSKADKTTTKATSTKTKSAEPTSTEDEESKTETEKESKTKTESEKETKTSDVPTTLATATTSKVSDASASATATATEGTGSGSGSGSSGDAQETGSSDGASSGDSGSETSSGDAAPSVSTVPVNSGSRMAGSIVAAAAGLFVAQLLI